MHKNRTASGVAKENKHKETYRKWWNGKYIEVYGKNNKKEFHQIIDAEYFGNSVYGGVVLHLDDGTEYYLNSYSYRPRKSDIEVFDKPQ